MHKIFEMFLPFLLIFFIISPLFSQQPQELSDEIRNDMLRVEQQMDSLAGQIRIRYRKDSLFLSKFENSQRMWKKYRDAQIDMKFPATNKQLEYGSNYPVCFSLEKIKITQKRIEDLKMWATGTIEGDACPGSVLIENK